MPAAELPERTLLIEAEYATPFNGGTEPAADGRSNVLSQKMDNIISRIPVLNRLPLEAVTIILGLVLFHLNSCFPRKRILLFEY